METTDKIRVLIADDHELFRSGLKLMLSKDDRVLVVGEAASGETLVELARLSKPDIILTDLVMPGMGGINAIKAIKADPGTAKIGIIALSMFNYEHLVVEAMEAGAKGYIIKNAEKGEIINAVKMLFNGKPYLCSSTTANLAKLITNSHVNPFAGTTVPMFNDIEKKIIVGICQEKTSSKMAAELFIGRRSIERYRAKIMEKMNVKTPAGVVIFAIKNYLFHIDH